MSKTNGLGQTFSTPDKNTPGTQSGKTPMGLPPAISSPETRRIRTTSVGKQPQQKWLADSTNRMCAPETDSMDEMIVGKKFFDYSKITYSKLEPLQDQQKLMHERNQIEGDVLQIVEHQDTDLTESVQPNPFTTYIPRIYDYSSITDVRYLSLAKQKELLHAEQTSHCSVFYRNHHKNLEDFKPDFNVLCCDEDLFAGGLTDKYDGEDRILVELQKNNRDISTKSSFDPNDSVLLGKSKTNTEGLNSGLSRPNMNYHLYEGQPPASSVKSQKHLTHGDVRDILKKVPGVAEEDLEIFLREKLEQSPQSLPNSTTSISKSSMFSAFPPKNESNRNFLVKKDTTYKDNKQKKLNFSQFALDAKKKIRLGDHEKPLIYDISNFKPAVFGGDYKQTDPSPLLPNTNRYNSINPSFNKATLPLMQKTLKNPDRKTTHLANLKIFFDEQQDDSKFGDVLNILSEEHIKQQYRFLKRDKKHMAKLKSSKKLAYLSSLEQPIGRNTCSYSIASPTATGAAIKPLKNDSFKHLCDDLWALDSFRF
ncbi:hypothetical protein ACO0QE_002757 [Hanseniaspora vineae]